MPGDRRVQRCVSFRLFATALACAISWGAPPIARAAAGPGCDAGAACADDDGDGFPACACAPAGARCDCDDSDPRAFPGAPEACDSVADLDCSGAAGVACGKTMGCLRGVCVPECIPLDDFGCKPYAHCETQGEQRLCAGDCSIYGCPLGSTCDDSKACVANCPTGVRCPLGQRCRGFGCVDPCEGVACAEGSTCSEGRCVPSCECAPGDTGCAPSQACDRALAIPRCVERACLGVACQGGAHCAAGQCVDDCAGVVCPPKRVCKPVVADGGAVRGACVDLCEPSPCPWPMVCSWRDGSCSQPTYPEAGLEPPRSDAAVPETLFVGGAGVSCTTADLGRASALGSAACALSLALLAARRARRRRPSSPDR